MSDTYSKIATPLCERKRKKTGMVGRRCILYRQFARYRNREEEEERRESDRIIAEMREKERSSGDDRRGSARIGENKRVDIARKREREAEKQLAFCTHVRSRDEGTRERVVTMMRRGSGVDSRWHAPVHCHHIRCGVMAFFSAYGRRTICALAYTYTIVSQAAKPTPFLERFASVCPFVRE